MSWTSSSGAADLDADGIVVDIGRATDALNAVLAGLSYRNLDDEPSFKGQNTTTEFLARAVFDRHRRGHRREAISGRARAGIESLRVTLHESHLASASFDGRV